VLYCGDVPLTVPEPETLLSELVDELVEADPELGTGW
jgi:hypothetical protein